MTSVTIEHSQGLAAHLRDIERLLAKAKRGEIDDAAALARIAVVARQAPRPEVYQKPLG